MTQSWEAMSVQKMITQNNEEREMDELERWTNRKGMQNARS